MSEPTAAEIESKATRRRAITTVLLIVGTILISVATSFFTFGQQQSASIVRLEESESEDARQRQVDQATITAVNEALRIVQERLATLNTATAVNATRLDGLAQAIEQLEARLP